MKTGQKLINLFLCLTVALTACDNNTNQVRRAERPRIIVWEESDITSVSDSDSEETKQQATSFYNNYAVTLEINPLTRKITVIEKISYKNQTGVLLNNIFIQFNISAFTNHYGTLPFYNEFRNKVYKNGRSYADFSVNFIEVNNEAATYELNDRHIEIKLENPLPPMENIDIALQFECTLPKICHRMGANDEAMWFGNFIPLIAYNENGRWQVTPYYKAGEPFVSEVSNFDVTITTPTDYSVYYGFGTEKITENETTKTTKITADMIRDFAFAVSNKYNTEKVMSDSGVEINFHYYTENLAATRINKILEVAKTAVDYYGAKIGAYPFQTIDIAEIELYTQGGAEYPNIIFLDSTYVKNTISFDAVSHSIAHQWFYNVVGSNQTKEAWIDEGLTSYVQSYMFESSLAVDRKMAGTYDMLSQALEGSENYALTTDLGSFASWQEYYNIMYLRSSLMFHALHKKMGSVKFDEFLKTYYSESSFKIAKRKDIVDISSKIYGERLDDFFESWISWKGLPEKP